MLGINKESASKILMILVLLSFTAIGIFGGMSQFKNNNSVVSRVGNVNIWKSDFVRLYLKELGELQSQYGISESELNAAGFKLGILKALEDQALLSNYIDEIGLSIDDETVFSNIRSNNVFFDEKGLFSQSKFESILKENGYTPEHYFQVLRHAILRASATSLLLVKPSLPTSCISDTMLKYRYIARSADFVTLGHKLIDDKKIKIGATSSEVEDYYNKNKESFLNPQKRKARFIKFDEGFFEKPNVLDEELSSALSVYTDEMNAKNLRDFTNVIFPDYDCAKNFLDKVESGISFDVALEEAQKGNENIVKNNITEISADDLPVQISDIVFNIEDEGQVGPIIDTNYGFHVIRLDKLRHYSQNELKHRVYKELMREKTRQQLSLHVDKIEDEIKKGATIEKIADRFGFNVLATGWIGKDDVAIALDPDARDAQGNQAFAQELTDLSFSRLFIDNIFNIGVGETSYVFTNEGEDFYYIVSPYDNEDESIAPFSDVKSKIYNVILEMKRDEELSRLANEIRENISKNPSPSNIARVIDAKNVSLGNIVYSPIISDRIGSQYRSEIIRELFSFKNIDSTTNIIKNEDGSYSFAILRAVFDSNKTDADGDTVKLRLNSVKSEVEDQLRREMHDSLFVYLRDKYKVRRNIDGLSIPNSQ